MINPVIKPLTNLLPVLSLIYLFIGNTKPFDPILNKLDK